MLVQSVWPSIMENQGLALKTSQASFDLTLQTLMLQILEAANTQMTTQKLTLIILIKQ